MRPTLIGTLAALLFIAISSHVAASTVQSIAPGQSTHIVLAARQEVELDLSGSQGPLSLVEIDLRGGLIAVRSNDMPRWALDLGRGGSVQYAVRSAADGKTLLVFSSIEATRVAEIDVRVMREPNGDLERLRTAEADLVTADTARRRWPGAPSSAVAEAKYDEAIALFRQMNNVPLLRLSLTQKSRFLLFEKSRFLEARALLLEAVGLKPDNDVAQLALAYKTLASVEAYLADYDRSITAGKKALALYTQNDDRYWQGIVLGNMADSYDRAGRMEDASLAAHDALADAEASQDAAGVVYCLGQIADIDRRQGQLDLALHAFGEARNWSQHISYAPLIQEEIEKAEGLFYAQLGLWDEAEVHLKECLDHAQDRRNATSLEAQGVLAEALEHRHKLVEAVRVYTEAIKLARSLKLSREEAMLLLQRAALLLTRHSYLKAQADLDRASDIAKSLGAPGLAAQVDVARGNFFLGSKHQDSLAHEAFQRALAQATDMGDREQQAAALAGLARVEQRQGALDDALGSIDKALAIVESSRSGLHNRTLSSSYLTLYRSWYELAASTAIQRSQQDSTAHARDLDVRLAFSYAERMKGRALLDDLSQAEGPVQHGLSKEFLHRIDVNQQAIEEKQSQLKGASGDVGAIAGTLKRLYEEQDILNAEAHAAGDDRVSGNAEMTATVGRLQHTVLTPDAVYLSYTLGEEHSYRWAVTSTGISVQVLPGKAALSRQLGSLRQKLLTGRPTPASNEDVKTYARRKAEFDSALQNDLGTTGRLLLKELPSNTRRIYLSAEGEMLSIPWAALRLPCHGRMCYSLEQFEICNEPSASVLVHLSENPSVSVPSRIVVVANPLVGDVALAGIRFPPLPGADREAAAIARVASRGQVQIVQGTQATPAAIEDLAALPYGIFHFAAHTVLIPQHPELSGIALSAEKTRARDGVLWLRDIRNLRLSPSLVVLNGCDTQVGLETTAEGLNSISQAFFFAGAHSVVGTLWKTDDDATVSLMQRFYRNMLVGRMSAAAALRSAQLALHRKDAHSMTWAAFVINGLPSPTYSSSNPSAVISESVHP